jgi:hypothetical protein
MEILLAHWIQWTNKVPMDISRSIGSIGHFRLAISMAWYLHDVHMLVITSFKDILIDQLKKQMSDGNSTCPLDPMDKQNSNGHFQVHWIHWTLSFGHLNGLAIVYMMSICFPLRHSNTWWQNEKENVRWKFRLSIGSNGHAKVQWTIRDPFDKRMSNGLLIFPSDILHRYWTLIIWQGDVIGWLRHCTKNSSLVFSTVVHKS